MPTCIETRIPTAAIQMFHAWKEGNAPEAERYFRMIQDIIQYEQGAGAEIPSSTQSENAALQRVLADFSGDTRFQSLSQVPRTRSSWAAWTATHTLPPKGPYIARVVYDYDRCLSATSPSLRSRTLLAGSAIGLGVGVVGLAAILFLSQKN
mgnify:CR=1 FL=1